MADIYQPIAGPVDQSPKKVIRIKDIGAIDGAGNAIYLPEVYVNNSAGSTSDVATETTLSAVNTKIPAIGQKASANSLPVVLASDQTLPLPSGASTSANQTTGNTNLISINAKLTVTPLASYGQMTVGTTRGALGSSVQLYQGLYVKADSANTSTVYIGGSSVTTSTGFILKAGDAVFVPGTDLSTIYAIASASSQLISFIGG
jgi:hypothetical protein